MTTHTTNTRLRHDYDAVFREWGEEFSTALSTIGLVKTSDTGQIDWATVLRPAVNTEAGYEIWRFNDAAQSTLPIFIRFGFGTGSVATSPKITFRIGTATNGAGVINANDEGTDRNLNSYAGSSADTARMSYFVLRNGFLGIVWKISASTTDLGLGFLVVARTVDSNGDATDEAHTYIAYANGIQAAPQHGRVYNKVLGWGTYWNSAVLCSVGATTFYNNSFANQSGLQQAIIPAWSVPTYRLQSNLLVVYNSLARGTAFTATPLGTTERTYLCIGNSMGLPVTSSALSGGTAPVMAMIWE